ncbi:polysaccharide deacetylase family protein [Ectobacillus polymachus]|uniref:polysaccharide deacetylase family protein n=1 Tax=Ectobacillus polymachus TaxID=1508806 RepID=UPI003A89AE54
MWIILFYFLLLFALLYAIIPNIIARLGFGVILKSRVRNEIAFTFDDGPNPIYTPQLLALLKKYGVKATFFVVGEKAERYPDILKQIHDEGHEIGIHNYVHVSNLLLSPWKLKKHLESTASYVEQITGTRPVFYRPPWGLINGLDFFIHRNFRMVIWSIIVGDWRTKGGSERIKQKLLRSIHDGDVIVLHDSGDTWGAEPNAPEFMLQSLEEVLQEVLKNGHTLVKMGQLFSEKTVSYSETKSHHL